MGVIDQVTPFCFTAIFVGVIMPGSVYGTRLPFFDKSSEQRPRSLSGSLAS